jgi:nucleotide-binding universal stress UspA family protein
MFSKRVLIPTDGSAISGAVARAGIGFAKRLKADAIGMYVAAEYVCPIRMESTPSASHPTEEEYKESARRAGEVFLQEMRTAASNADLQFTGIIVFSDSPAKDIADTAQQNGCNFIFMGSTGEERC